MNIKTYRKIAIIIVLLVSALPSLAQEKTKEPEQLITETKSVNAKIKVGQSKASEVRGEATYTIEAVNSDDSFAGTFVYKIPEDARRELAKVTGKSLSDIPVKFEQKDVIADLEKNARCPALRLEFPKPKIESSEIEISFERFALILPDTPQDVSKLVCRFAEAVFVGRTNPGRYRRPINDLLNPEK